MYSKVKLDERMEGLHKSLAEEKLLTDKSREKLFKKTQQTVDRLREAAENHRIIYKDLSDAAEDLASRLKDTEIESKKRRFIQPAPANNTIDYREAKEEYFAKGKNFYKCFLILFIGSFVGVIVELLWCFVRHGYFESRSGLVYGPFNLVYGIGALVLTLALFKYRNRSWIYSFIGGFLTGTVVEYLCSYFQEMLFGSTSWDYSNVPFNINGRVCLIYSIFWGILGILWIKNIYPRLAELLLKIPNKIGKISVYILLVFMVFNSLVSGLAVMRWEERVRGKEAANGYERFMDERFPNERLEKIYANLEFSK